jgi:hypothetical protein
MAVAPSSSGINTLPFIPHSLLKNGHVMTLASMVWPRNRFPVSQPGTRRVFKVDPHNSISAICYWQNNPKQVPTIVAVHGLESNSKSRQILGVVQKAIASGMNAVAVNLRNCDGDYFLSNSLYNCGMSSDIKAVIQELAGVDGLPTIFLIGYSLGGNIVLKAAGEFGSKTPSYLHGVCAISPVIDPAACVDYLQKGFSRLYQANFLASLKRRIKEMHRVNPGNLKLGLLDKVKSIRDFDEHFTAPDAAYLNADDYYQQSASINLLPDISIPALIVQSEDDPFIPAFVFRQPALGNPCIRLLLTKHGGHCAFIQNLKEPKEAFDSFWAENRAIEFCLAQI